MSDGGTHGTPTTGPNPAPSRDHTAAPPVDVQPGKAAQSSGGPYRRPPGMGIFLSYRRDDSAGHAGRLQETLGKRFGSESVFRDLDAIPMGSDFVVMIDAAIRRAEVVLVVMGPRWATIGDEAGRRRLDNPNDFVRREVEAALAQDGWIIPVLVGGARMPPDEVLPAALKPLARRNAVELTDLRWSRDVHELIVMLARSRGPVRRIVDTYHRVRDLIYRLTRPRILVPAGILALGILILVLISGGGGSTPAGTLTSLIPATIRSQCTVVSSDSYLYPSIGVTASAQCQLASGSPGASTVAGTVLQPQVIYYALVDNKADLQTSFAQYLANSRGSNDGAFNHGAISGTWGTGTAPTGQAYVLYTADQKLVLVLAESNSSGMQSWFQTGAGDPGT